MINLVEPKVILDMRGLVLHAAHRGDDPNGQKNEDGKVEYTAEYAFESFIETYLIPILQEHAPRNIIGVWDTGSEFRKDLFPGYKKKRQERPISDFLKEQNKELFSRVKYFLHSLGIIQCAVDGVEADDIIALLAERLQNFKMIYTVDADLSVLSGEKCIVLLKNDPVGAFYTYKSGSGDNKRQTEVPTKYVSLFKSLIGDSSDEYPGIKGFGPVKWEALVKEYDYDGIDTLLKCVESGKFEELEEAVKETGDPTLSMLFVNRYEWCVQYALAKLHPELCEGAKGNKFTKILWHKRVPKKDVAHMTLEWARCADLWPKFEPFMITTELVTNENVDRIADHFIANVAKAPVFSFDYESYDVNDHAPFRENDPKYVDVLSQSITGCSISYGANLNHTIYLSSDHADTDNIDDMVIWDFLDEALSQGVYPIAHNAPFEIALTDTNFEKIFDKPVIDTRIMSAYVDENDSNHLKDLSGKHLKYSQTTYKTLLEQCRAENMRQLTGDEVLRYGCDDSIVTSALFDLFYIILQIEGTWDFLVNEFDTHMTLYEAFESGLVIDFKRMSVLQAEDQKTITEGTAVLHKTLKDNCTEISEERALPLYEKLAEFHAAKMREDGKSEEEIADKLDRLRQATVDASKYRPLQTFKKEVSFKPTVKQINNVINKIGLGTELTGVSKTRVNEWAVPALNEIDLSADQKAFIEALVDATPHFKSREGEVYEKFVDICQEVLQVEAKEESIGDELNMDSPNQMQQLLYAKLGLPIRLYSKVQPNSTRDKLGMRGSPATSDKAVDTALAEDVEAGSWQDLVLRTMKDVKAANTSFKYYYIPYPNWVHPRDGRVHASTTNCGTVTHRFTGSAPNPYQLSKKRGGRIRTFILPKEKDHVILSPDFNGEELRITASLSNDPVMIDAYMGEQKKDLHSLTAAAITPVMLPRLAAEYAGTDSCTYEEFLEALNDKSDPELAGYLKEIRNLAKGVNFLILYVGGPGTLSQNLGVPVEVAQKFIEATLNQYPRLKPWQNESIDFAREHGYVLTAYGNRRHLGNDLFSEDNYLRTKAERQAVNSQVQGTGSDIMKVVLAEMWRRKTLIKRQGSLIVPPYDEVAVSVPRPAAWDCWLEMQEIMSITPPGNAVPQLPELKASALNWGTCIEMGADVTEEEFNEYLDRQLGEEKAA